MKKLVINNALLIGHVQIDDEHLHLASLINKVIDAKSANTPLTCAETIDEIVDKLKVHFDSEEQIMTELGYPETAAHSLHHQECMNTLMSIDSRCGKGNCLELNCATDVVSMFVDDLLGADMAFKGYLQEIGFRA